MVDEFTKPTPLSGILTIKTKKGEFSSYEYNNYKTKSKEYSHLLEY